MTAAVQCARLVQRGWLCLAAVRAERMAAPAHPAHHRDPHCNIRFLCFRSAEV